MTISNAQKRRQAKFQASRTASPVSTWQTPIRGTNVGEFDIFLACADDGNGGDTTRGGAPLPTFDEWLNR